MNFEATFMTNTADAALGSMEDQSASGKAAREAIRSVIASGALGDDRLVHVHATTSERMVAVLIRIRRAPRGRPLGPHHTPLVFGQFYRTPARGRGGICCCCAATTTTVS